MKKLALLVIVALISYVSISCKSERREMNLEDYAKIQAEVNIPDPALDPQLVEKIASKYGYSFEDFKHFNEKVEKDPKLREQLGEIRLKK
jgi:hypothetical protein